MLLLIPCGVVVSVAEVCIQIHRMLLLISSSYWVCYISIGIQIHRMLLLIKTSAEAKKLEAEKFKYIVCCY